MPCDLAELGCRDGRLVVRRDLEGVAADIKTSPTQVYRCLNSTMSQREACWTSEWALLSLVEPPHGRGAPNPASLGWDLFAVRRTFGCWPVGAA